MKPTDEQLKKFWEACGFVFEEHNSRFEHWWTYFTPDDMQLPWHERHQHTGYPSIDSLEALGFLFKWAVPKVYRYELGYDNYYRKHYAVAFLETDTWVRMEDNSDPALALFWALYKVLVKG